MKLISDYHIHSKNSRFFHGKNTIEEIATIANELGLKEIAITDHGFSHMCRTSYEKMKHAREKINEINEKSTVRVLLGIEADIISEDGTIDVDERTLDLLDILIVGYHKMIKTDFAGYFGGQSKKQEAIDKCTNAFVNAINKYPVTIVSHLDSILKTDLYKIGVACEEKGVLVEINNRHLTWGEDQINDLLASGCSFVVSSDAHKGSEIGKVDRAFKFIKDNNIPTELISNVEFEDGEKSNFAREFDADLEFFENARKRNEQKRREFERKQQESRPRLSNEMEDKLMEIAQQGNMKYSGADRYVDEKLPDLPYTFEEMMTIERAKAIISGENFVEKNKERTEAGGQKGGDKEFVVDLSTGKKIELKKEKEEKSNSKEKSFDEDISDQFGGFLNKNKKTK